MANNRMYLRCRTCGECFYLGKTFLNGYYWVDYYNGKKGTLEQRLNEFYDKHNYCGREPISEPYLSCLEPRFVPKEVDTENQFEIAYEIWYGDGDDE